MMPGLSFEPESGKIMEKIINDQPVNSPLLVFREYGEDVFDFFCKTYEDPDCTSVTVKSLSVTSFDSTTVVLWHVIPEDVLHSTTPTPAIFYLHPGGHMLGTAQMFIPVISRYARSLGMSFLAVEYRLAPEHPFPCGVNDAFAAYKYVIANSKNLNIDPAKITVMGDSSGGGLAAGLCIWARDEKLEFQPVKQILLEPMLDDRTTLETSHDRSKFLSWTNFNNKQAWDALLGEKAGDPQADVSPYVAPARVKDLSGLPPVYADIGSLDMFVEETLDYVKRLSLAGVEVEIHIWPGLAHSHDIYGLKTTQKAMGSRIQAIKKGVQ